MKENYIISGIQQIGIGVENFAEAWRYYIEVFNMDIRILEDENGNSRADNTKAWHTMNVSVNLSELGTVPAGEYDIYLKINDPLEQSINKRSIRFANKGNMWNAELGANYIGSTTIK